MHWSEVLARKVIEQKAKPYVITAGASVSGPAHFGTVCEFLYPWAIQRALEDLGERARFIFVVDDYDPLDKVPRGYEQTGLNQHLGKPLIHVPDPFGEYPSIAERWANEIFYAMEQLEVKPEIIRAHEFYSKGHFIPYTLTYLQAADRVKEIIEKIAGRENPKIIYPVCENCGRIDKTVVIEWDDKGYKYRCEACGHTGEARFAEGKYKLHWRLHWPAWWAFLRSSIEGAGADHHAAGGSWDTGVAIAREILGIDPPIGYKYGLLMVRGKKYSKSKGGADLKSFFELVPPYILKYFLLRKDLDRNQNFEQEPEFLLGLIAEYERVYAGRTTKYDEAKEKAVHLVNHPPIKNFETALMLYAYLRNYDAVLERVGNAEAVSLAKRWVERGFIPQWLRTSADYQNPVLQEFLAHVKAADDASVRAAVKATAERLGMSVKDVFKALYRALLGKDRGPRLSTILAAIGLDRLKGHRR